MVSLLYIYTVPGVYYNITQTVFLYYPFVVGATVVSMVYR